MTVSACLFGVDHINF